MFSQGDYQETGNPLDLVIEGDGFFQVMMPDGSIAYTRSGSFKHDSQGQIATSDGFAMKDQITIPQDAQDIAITSDGTVQVVLPGQAAPQQLGVIELARFTNPAGLADIGRNMYMPTAASGAPITGTPGMNGFGTIVQRFLEMSNVKVVEEMVNLIVAQRAYEINSKAIQTADEMLSIANNLRR
jgi:flagellar basal-body rod protein FlgG